MAKLVHIERGQVKAACAAYEKQIANDPAEKQERKERDQWVKSEMRRRDREFAATQPKLQKTKRKAK
jgi:hypothetical protein